MRFKLIMINFAFYISLRFSMQCENMLRHIKFTKYCINYDAGSFHYAHRTQITYQCNFSQMLGNRKQRICKWTCIELLSDCALPKIDNAHASVIIQMQVQFCLDAMDEAVFRNIMGYRRAKLGTNASLDVSWKKK